MSDDKRTWTWQHAIIKSDLEPTTRHVLLTLALYMNAVGGGCYPTQEQLAVATGLSERAVRKHLEIAETLGWLHRNEHGFKGQRWKNHEYKALWPGDKAAADEPALIEKADPLHIEKGAERGAGPRETSTGISRRKDRHQIPPTIPNQSNNPLPQTGELDPAQDVVSPTTFVHALLDEGLWNAVCDVSHHRKTMTNKDGGWVFPTSQVQQARQLLTA
jgi:hypothetical protein